MEQFLNTETLIIELLLVVSLVAIAVRRLRVPYTVALVIAGLLITFQQPLQFSLTSELILALFVPPLVFEAAFHVNVAVLQRNLTALVLLTIPGVLITTLIVGSIVALGTPLSLPLALVFGALISATDPVAVVALFKTLGAPKRLAVLVEGESLLNDGTALVIFNIALASVLTGHFSPLEGVVDFVRVAAGGVGIGLMLGWVTARLIAHVDDYLIETTLTTVLAYGAYLTAERLHVSEVLAVVAAGLVNGNIGAQGMSPTTRIVLFNFWEYVAFLANSLVFLLIGLRVNIPDLLNFWQPVLWAIGAVLLARVIVVYGSAWIVSRFAEPIPLLWQHVLTWGGLRGALSLALVLSLPATVGPERELLRVMAFGVALFTLLVQGTTMGRLIKRLHIADSDISQMEYERRHARLASLQMAAQHLREQHDAGIFSSATWDNVKAELVERTQVLQAEVRELLQVNPKLAASELSGARKELLRAQRSALMALRHDGVISDEAMEQIAAEIDSRLLTGSE